MERGTMTTLLRMELLKLLKRPMTWVLAILLHGGIGFIMVVTILELRGAPPDEYERILQSLSLMRILPGTTEFVAIFGAIMLAILTASAIGSEYGWGTLRPLLATGIPRGRFLAAKLLALALVAVAFVVGPLAMNAALAVPVALANDRPVLPVTVDAAWIGDLAAMIGRTYLVVAASALVAFLVGLLGRSQAAGIGTALGIMLGEQIVAALILSLNPPWGRAVVNLFPGLSIQALVGTYNDFGPTVPEPDVLAEGRALLTLGLYCVAYVAIAYLVFRRRDIRGAA
jgi:ABC-2 type transport system permease protein